MHNIQHVLMKAHTGDLGLCQMSRLMSQFRNSNLFHLELNKGGHGSVCAMQVN